MLGMLVAYDAANGVFATLDYMVRHDASGAPVGLVDFEAYEAAGGEMTDVWSVAGAAGSKSWPEWIGGRAHDFLVELEGPPGAKRIAALVHRTSGHRRERASIEAAIRGRIQAAQLAGGPADLRDLVGGPDRPLELDSQGRTIRRTSSPAAKALPLVGVSPGTG